MHSDATIEAGLGFLSHKNMDLTLFHGADSIPGSQMDQNYRSPKQRVSIKLINLYNMYDSIGTPSLNNFDTYSINYSHTISYAQ